MPPSFLRKKSTLIVTGLFGALLAGELLVRLTVPEWSDQWKLWRVDPTHAVGLYPSVREKVRGISREFEFEFATNAQGLRMNWDLSESKPHGIKRVLFVGDSFTFGYGVNQNEDFVSLLQEEIDPLRKKLELVNAGFASGFTTDTEYLFVREKGHRYSPDVVIVGVCLGNDFEDLFSNDWETEGEKLVAVHKRKSELPTWQKKSALAGYTIRRLLPTVRNSTKPVREPSSEISACDLKREENRPSSSPYKRLKQIMQTWKADAEKNNYDIVFLFIPEREEIQGKITTQELNRMRLVRSQFAAAAYLANGPVWDMTADMRTESCSKNQPFYFEKDGHWNLHGHKFAARWLTSRVSSLPRLGIRLAK